MNHIHQPVTRWHFMTSCKGLLLLALFLAVTTSFQVRSQPPVNEEVQLRAILSAARNSVALQDVADAVVLYERYLDMQPDDSAVALELAGVLVQGKRYESALPVLDSVLTRDPSNPQAQQLRAVALSHTGNLTEAIAIVERLITRFPEDVEIRRLAAGFRSMQGNVNSMRDIQRQFSEKGVQTTADLEVFLQLLASAGEWEELLETFEENKNRLDATDPIRLSLVRAHLARYEIAVAKGLSEEMDTENGQREVVLLISDQLAAARRLDEAIRFLEPMARARPMDSELSRRLALIYAYDNRPVEAVDVLARIPEGVRDERIQATRAEIYRAAGQYHHALRELDRMTDAGQRSNPARLTRAGILYDLQREWELPLELEPLSRAERVRNVSEEKLALVLITLSYLRAGDVDSAQRALERLRSRAPQDTAPDILETMTTEAARRTSAMQDSVSRLGNTLRNYRPGLDIVRPALLDDVPAAAWEKAWHLNPENYSALLWLADTLFTQGLIEEAQEHYEIVARDPKTSGDALLGLIACALRFDDTHEAQRLILQLKGLPLRFRQHIKAARLMLEADLDGHADYFITAIPEDLGGHPDTVAVRAAWLLRGGRVEEARQMLSRLKPDSPADKGAMVYQLFRMGSLARDADDLTYRIAMDQLLALGGAVSDPSGLDALLPAADLMIQFNQYPAAKELLGRVHRQWPNDLRISERATVVHIRMGEYEEAQSHIRTLLVRRPMRIEPRLLLARIHLWTNQYEAAWADYRNLITDYPQDEALVHEFQAKRSMVLSRYKKAVQSYSEWLDLEPGEREARIERADSYFFRDLSQTAQDEYRFITAGFPHDAEARASLRAAEQRTAWGTYGEVGFTERRGRDEAVDIGEESVEVGVLFPRGPDGLQVGAGVRVLEWDFNDIPTPDRTIRANEVRVHATQNFHSGVETRGEIKLVDDGLEGTAWHAELDVGYRGLAGWKAAVIAGREILRDNFYTIQDSLPRTWLGMYGQWQPATRLELFGQARVMNTDGPSRDAALPERALDLEGFTTELHTDFQPSPAGTLGDALDRRTTLIPSTRGLIDDTFKRNTAYEAILDATWTIFFFPHSLKVWANGFMYDTRHDNLLYWTPEDTFFSAQVGLHWRHSPWYRELDADQTFFYGAKVGAGQDSESESFSSLLFELGWVQGNGFSLKAETGGVWSDVYDERHAHLYMDFRF